jgi:hypothetical protein
MDMCATCLTSISKYANAAPAALDFPIPTNFGFPMMAMFIGVNIPVAPSMTYVARLIPPSDFLYVFKGATHFLNIVYVYSIQSDDFPGGSDIILASPFSSQPRVTLLIVQDSATFSAFFSMMLSILVHWFRGWWKS